MFPHMGVMDGNFEHFIPYHMEPGGRTLLHGEGTMGRAPGLAVALAVSCETSAQPYR